MKGERNMERISREIIKVLAVMATFTIGFILFWLMPDDNWSIDRWMTIIIFTKAGGVILIWSSYLLYERWNKTGWLKRYKDWVEEAEQFDKFDREEVEQ